MEKTRNTGFLISTIAFCVVALAALPLRTYQFLTNIEAGTGFYIDSANILIYVLYGIIGAGIVISMASALLYKSELGFDRTPAKRPVQGIISLLTAVAVLFDAALDLNTILNYSPETSEMTKVSLYVLCAQSLFAVLAAIFFVVFGISMLSGATNASEYKIISVAPTVWFMFRLIFRFTATISFIKVSDLLLEMFMLAFMLIFFTAFAQLNSKIESKGLDWKLVAFGLPAAVLALVCFIPRFIMVISGKSEILYTGSPVEYCDLATALFALSIVLTRIGWVGGNADAKEEAQADENAAAETEGTKDN
ncbi:MAG: hypothetical protein IJM10_02205 [Clostridia bacterium]|nr:hypothetical protein [Clostridia bacterium]